SIGDAIVQPVEESVQPSFVPQQLLPECSEDAVTKHLHWMAPLHYDVGAGKFRTSVRSYLVRTGRHVVLIDCCGGNHKNRPYFPRFHRREHDWLDRLAAAGVTPEQVDYVMCTHLHSDHVGWNTQLRDGRWVPTFPKAKYIFAQKEWETWEQLHAREPQQQLIDSVLPVMEARQAQLVSSDFALDDEVWLEPTPGHTQGHVCIRLASRGAQAIITGDCIHSPVQCLAPQWIMRADVDPALAVTTRRNFLERYCDSGVTVCATHFPEPSL